MWCSSGWPESVKRIRKREDRGYLIELMELHCLRDTARMHPNALLMRQCKTGTACARSRNSRSWMRRRCGVVCSSEGHYYFRECVRIRRAERKHHFELFTDCWHGSTRPKERRTKYIWDVYVHDNWALAKQDIGQMDAWIKPAAVNHGVRNLSLPLQAIERCKGS